MEADMYDPNIAAYSQIRYYEVLEDAENQRRCRRSQANNTRSVKFLSSLIQALKGLFSKDQREAASEEMAAAKS
jgi:hypothetical protein